MDTLPEQGTLEAYPLPALLLTLHRRRAGGRLDLAREGVEKRVWLRDGVPVLAESNLPSESLGIQLLDAGRIGREDYARVVETVQQRRCKEGAALLALELIRPQELFAALKDQVRRRVLDCFGWVRGSFAFDGDDLPAADATAFRCDPIALCHEGVSIHWSPTHLRGALGAQLDRYAVPTRRFALVAERLHRDEDVERLVAGLDGNARLRELLGERPGPLALAAAWVLDGAGAVRWSERPEPKAEPGALVGDGIVPEIEIVVDGGRAAAPAAARPGRAAPAARAAGAGPSPEAEALRREIERLHGSLGERDHYELLGVAPDAPTAAIKRAYFSAAKRFHPDALARLGLTELRGAAQTVFARIAEAYEVLCDPERRRDYDRARESDAQDGEAARLVQAEALYRKAEVLLRAGNFNGAVEFLKPAVALWPEEAAYQSALGWALHKKRPSEPKEARAHLERAIALEPNDAVAHFRLGIVLRALGEHDAAEREAALARRLDPKVR